MKQDPTCIKRIFQVIAVLVLVILPSVARADEIAVFNFNDSNLVVDRGVGTLTTSANVLDVSFTVAGSVARNGDPAGMALNIAAGAGFRNNGSTLTLTTSTAGFTNVVVTFDFSRSATGFNSVPFEFSTNLGATFMPIATFDPGTGGLFVTAFSAAFNNQASLIFRWTLNGATNTAGTIRFDNMRVAGDPLAPVPEPVTMILLGTGLAGIAAKMRRRKLRL
jgi:hypothetical protein